MDERTDVFPTPERFARGEVERLDRAQDEQGAVSRPHRSVSILVSLYRKGKITGEMCQAGEDFRNLFDRAQLDARGCIDISRPMVSHLVKPTGIFASRVEDAREAVYQAINAVGGYRSDAGNLLINVLGWGWSIKAWSGERSRTTRPISEHEASGVLQGALGVLAMYFEKNSP